jgi:hypothetical protein
MNYLKVVAVTIVFLPLQAFAIAAYPMSFWGNIKIDGVSAPIGTVITAYDSTPTEVGSIVVKETGVYGYNNPLKQRLLISSANGMIVFKITHSSVNAGVETGGIDQVSYSAFSSGTTVNKDLNFRTTLTVVQVAPDVTGSVTVTATTTQAVISSSTQPITLTVATGTLNPTIDVSSLITNGVGVLPEITITSADTNNTSIAIPASTVVTSASTTWDGVIAAPTLTTVAIPDTNTEVTTLSTAIEIGFSGAELTFSKAVRLLIPNQAGKRAGYVRDGIPFTEITSICTADTQIAADAMPAGDECKMDVGADLVIWTKHFTTFATYTSTVKPVTVTNAVFSGGGSANAPVALQNIIATLNTLKPKGQVLGVSVFSFLKNLGLGSRGADVAELQKVLIKERLLATSATGYFGPITKAALMKWQAKNKLPATGYFGPMSRLALQSKNK